MSKIEEAAQELPSDVAFVLENLYESLRGIIGAETRGLIVAELGQVVDAFTEALASAEQRAREAREPLVALGGATTVCADDHKDARQDAQHALQHPSSPHGRDGIFLNLARCYLALQASVLGQRERAASEAVHDVRARYTDAWRAAGGGETASQTWLLPSDLADALTRVREQVRAETLAACVEGVREWFEGDPPNELLLAVRDADLPGADALARREQAAAVRALREAASLPELQGADYWKGPGHYRRSVVGLLGDRADAIAAEAAAVGEQPGGGATIRDIERSPLDDPGYQAWLESCTEDCKCCPSCSPEGCPCASCTAGGVCMAFECTCFHYEGDDDFEDEEASDG